MCTSPKAYLPRTNYCILYFSSIWGNLILKWYFPGRPRFSPEPPWCSVKLDHPVVFLHGYRWQSFHEVSCIQGNCLAVASMNAVSNHISPMIRRVTVNYLCLGQKKKAIFTARVTQTTYTTRSEERPRLDSKDSNYVLAIMLVSFKLTDTVSKICGQLFRAEDWAI